LCAFVLLELLILRSESLLFLALDLRFVISCYCWSWFWLYQSQPQQVLCYLC